MTSLTPGKAMAQACHVGGQLHEEWERNKAYKNWAKQADGFGTTIVLDGVCEELILKVARHARSINESGGAIPFGLVMDERYPVRDGLVTHSLPIITCGYVLVNKDNEDMVERLGILEFSLLRRGYEPQYLLGTKPL